jgi:hypothetical protein
MQDVEQRAISLNVHRAGLPVDGECQTCHTLLRRWSRGRRR